MDPLSDVLSLLKPRSYASGGFDVGGGCRSSSPSMKASVDFRTIPMKGDGRIGKCNGGGDCLIVGGHVAFAANHAGILFEVLPPIVHIRKESDKAAMRWSLERMMQELREPQPGTLCTTILRMAGRDKSWPSAPACRDRPSP
jgi:hypothetical protein